MKWLTPLLPYLAVILGIFRFQSAWAGLLGFHAAIVISLLLGRSSVPLKLLFASTDSRWIALSILLSGTSGVALYLFWPSLGIAGDLSARLNALGLTPASWSGFIAYFTLANPFIEEYFWRGYLGTPANDPHISDFLYAGFHAFILIDKVQTGSILFALAILVLAGWFWRQVARADHGLLAAVLGHMAADFTILLAVYQMASSPVG